MDGARGRSVASCRFPCRFHGACNGAVQVTRSCRWAQVTFVRTTCRKGRSASLLLTFHKSGYCRSRRGTMKMPSSGKRMRHHPRPTRWRLSEGCAANPDWLHAHPLLVFSPCPLPLPLETLPPALDEWSPLRILGWPVYDAARWACERPRPWIASAGGVWMRAGGAERIWGKGLTLSKWFDH